MIRARRSAVALATCAVAALVVAGSPALANSVNGANRLEATDAIKFAPAGANLDAKAIFIAQLKNPSVVELGKGVNAASARASILAAQKPAVDAAASVGATVTNRYADAIDAFAFVGSARQAAALAKNGLVATINKTTTYTLDNTNSDTFTGSAATWENLGHTGVGQKIAIIDSGIDYDHVDFGGAGLDAWTANDKTIVEPGTFPTAKVVGGYDFVGDNYNAAASGAALTPTPDADPSGCYYAGASAGDHGTHVAGTAAGFGVKADGTTFTGPYTAANIAALKIGPGSAPGASLLAYRVFGCSGSVGSDIIVAAVNRAVADGATEINMSLGSSFGGGSGAEQTAVTNAFKAGVVSIISAGNSGPNPYITGAPGSTPASLSVAAVDGATTLPGITVNDGLGHTGFGMKLGTLDAPASLKVYSANMKLGITTMDRLGCLNAGVSPFNGIDLTGKLLIVQRGTCTFAEKLHNARMAGASALIIMQNATSGNAYLSGVTFGTEPTDIPIYGTQYFTNTAGTVTNLVNWRAMDGLDVSVTTGPIPNPTATLAASFSSGGPRFGDAGFKPDISSPGVNVVSAALGTGNGAETMSGTSMAAPHATGDVALVRSAHPTWTAAQTKAAVVNNATKDASKWNGLTRVMGNGLIQPAAAISNGLLVYPTTISKDGDTSLSFGVREDNAVSVTRLLTVDNQTGAATTVHLSSAIEGAPAGYNVTFSKNDFTVAKGASVQVIASFTATQAAMAATSSQQDQVNNGAYSVNLIFGQISATHTGNGAAFTSTLPFSAAPFGRSAINVRASGNTLTATNTGIRSAYADVYDWALADAKDTANGVDIKSVGVQTYPTAAIFGAGSGYSYVFSFNTWNQIYNPAAMEADFYFDTTGDGKPDYVAYTYDSGYMSTGSFNGTVGTYLVKMSTGASVNSAAYTWGRPFNSSTFQFLIKGSAIGLDGTAGNNLLKVVEVDTYPWDGDNDTASGTGTINAWNPQRNNGDGSTIAAGASDSYGLSSRDLAAGESRTLGWDVVVVDNRTGLQSLTVAGK